VANYHDTGEHLSLRVCTFIDKIQRTFNTKLILSSHMRINHRGLYTGVSQQLLNRPNVMAVFYKMCRKTVAQAMHSGMLSYTGSLYGLSKTFTHDAYMEMMPADFTTERVYRQLR
jgi:hypothetical protein